MSSPSTTDCVECGVKVSKDDFTCWNCGCENGNHTPPSTTDCVKCGVKVSKDDFTCWNCERLNGNNPDARFSSSEQGFCFLFAGAVVLSVAWHGGLSTLYFTVPIYVILGIWFTRWCRRNAKATSEGYRVGNQRVK